MPEKNKDKKEERVIDHLNNVVLTEGEYIEMLEKIFFLNCLFHFNVSSWSGFADARAKFEAEVGLGADKEMPEQFRD